MTATEELRRLLDERSVEWMPSVWSAKDETFYKVGEVGYLATELSSGRMKVCIEGYPTPAQAIDATLGRGTTTRTGKYRTKYGRRIPVCERCGYGIGDMRWHYCPSCGAEVID